MNKNSHFLVSDSFYKMEYDTPNHRVFDIYEIAEWDIDVVREFNELSPIELLTLLDDLLKFFPWLYPKEIGLRHELKRTFFSDLQSFVGYKMSVFNDSNHYEGFEWDLGVLECGLKLIYLNEEVRLNNKSQVRIYASFDPEYKRMSFNLCFWIDVFTTNPSRQPGVTLTNEQVTYYRKLLETSLRDMEESGVFRISGFQSDFHPNLVRKFGFNEKN